MFIVHISGSVSNFKISREELHHAKDIYNNKDQKNETRGDIHSLQQQKYKITQKKKSNNL